MSSTILLSRLNPCVDETIGDYQCGKQIKYRPVILHSAVKGGKIKAQWDSTSAIYIF
jgi:hypothetical protein